MRSSKSRSRSKSNRNRSVGNIVNRVFDSSGPEGKVRGTPQQIIDKYNQLARDAQLGNDRVAAENFQQHAEHYTRLLGEAQRDQDARREQQEREQQDRDQRERDQRDRQRDDQSRGDRRDGGEEQRGDRRDGGDGARGTGHRDSGRNAPAVDNPVGAQPDAMAVSEQGNAESGLVETPEATQDAPPKPKRKPRARKPKAEADGTAPDDKGRAEAAE